jgi:hypothetical protein
MQPGWSGRRYALLVIVGVAALLLLPGASRGGGSSSPRSGQFGGIVAHQTARNASGFWSDECPCGSGNLSYHSGGPIMSTNTNYAIYWLPPTYSYNGNNAGYEATLNQYLTDVAHDSHTKSNAFALATQYTDNVSGGHNVAYDSTFSGSVVVTDALPSNGCAAAAVCLTDAQLRTEIQSVVTAQGWPQNLTSEYILFTPPGLESCFDSSNTECSTNYYCAYHSYFASTGGQIVYANMTYAKTGGCDIGEYPNSSDADPTISVLSHELNESITDPHLNAWFDAAGYENGDKCSWTFGTLSGTHPAQYNQTINGHHYLMQEEWSNTNSTCYPTAPAPTVTSFSPSSGVAGDTVTVNGTFLTDATGVSVGGHAMSDVTVVNDKQITATVPAGAATGTISVATGAGTGTSAGSFTFTGASAPSVTSFAPTSGYPGQTVTIQGSNFTGSTDVSFNVTSAADFSVDSDTQITATVPVGASTGPISVTAPGGTSASLEDFLVVPAPAAPKITSFSPAAAAAGSTVTIIGSGFTDVSGVTFNGQSATSHNVVSASKITAVVAAGTTSGPITVSTPHGDATSVKSFGIPPHLTSFSPLIGPASTSLAIHGSGFVGTTAVKVNGKAVSTFNVDSDTLLHATVATGSTSGKVSITTPGGTVTSSDLFAMIAVNAFAPAKGMAGATVTITGTNFGNATGVLFNGALGASFHWVSSTKVTAVVPDGTTSGVVTVVNTTDGNATSAKPFGIVPAVSSFTPLAAPAATPISISGSGFTGETAVYIGSKPAAHVTVDSDTHITATVGAATASGKVTVTTPYGKAIGVSAFTMVAITALAPAKALIGAKVTITGSGFTDVSSVSFNGTNATSYAVVSATKITAFVPTGTTTGTVSVDTANGTATSTKIFTLLPKIDSFTPSSGPTTTSVTIHGSGFSGATAVRFNGKAAATFSVDSDTQITATVAAGTTTGKVTVVTPAGTATSGTPFTVTAT